MASFISNADSVRLFLLGFTGILVIASYGIISLHTLRHAGKSLRNRLLVSIPLVSLIVSSCALAAHSPNIVIQQQKQPTVNTETELSQRLAMDFNSRIVEEGAVLLKNSGILPLSPDTTRQVNLFGIASVHPVYSSQAKSDDAFCEKIGLAQALLTTGISSNPNLLDFYQSQPHGNSSNNVFSFGADKGELYEPSIKEYRDLIAAATQYSDVAFVVFGRQVGESGDARLDMADHGGDAGRHYLQLQDVEMDLLNEVLDRFSKTVVLLNGANPLESGFLDDPRISAAIWISEPGDSGMTGVANLITGKATPSGRLPDTWAYNFTHAPSFASLGKSLYVDADGESLGFDATESITSGSYIDYLESIYVGYRYYETRWASNTGQVDEERYHEEVQFPFGFGLSYTNFGQKLETVSINDDELAVTVSVSNLGSYSGKEVVQLYSSPPYEDGGIEKARVVLIGSAKTDILAPGEKQTITLTIPFDRLASYDRNTNKAWVLEAGDYAINLQSDSHRIIDSETIRIPSTIIYSDSNSRPGEYHSATNQFDDVTYGNGNTYLSRADWDGTEPVADAPAKVASTKRAAALANLNPTVGMVTSSGPSKDADVAYLTLSQAAQRPADSSLWDSLASEVPHYKKAQLFSHGGWRTHPINDIGLPAMISADGPLGLLNYSSGETSVGFASTTLLAASFNTDLSREYGEILGKEMRSHGYHGIYGPGLNIHRTPFSGRNFEYYSEDPFHSASIAAATIRGLHSEGITAFVKHFAVNDQETHRVGVATWLDEQALREIYLRPFELLARSTNQGKLPSFSLMGSYNRLGEIWTGANSTLNRTVLRGEWGFQGTLVSDFPLARYMNPEQALIGGTDLMLNDSEQPIVSQTVANSPEGQAALHDATKHILFTIAHSSAMEDSTISVASLWPLWCVLLISFFVSAYGIALFRFPKA